MTLKAAHRKAVQKLKVFVLSVATLALYIQGEKKLHSETSVCFYHVKMV